MPNTADCSLTWTAASPDGRFAVAISRESLSEMLRHWSTAPSKETGGILVGRYSPDQRIALVNEISGPPSDSRANSMFFLRGRRGLLRRLLSAWQRSAFYLGEWHVHPGGCAQPSAVDRLQMHGIANTAGYGCPEPVLCILGGTPDQWEIGAWVFRQSGPAIQLCSGAGLSNSPP